MMDRGSVGRWVSRALALVALLGVLPKCSQAQDKHGTIVGRVVTSTDGTPVAGVRVTLLGARKSVSTDSLGRFTFERLKPSVYQLEVALIGLTPLAAVVNLSAGGTKEVEFRTDDAGQLLPTIYVDGESRPTLIKVLTKFERRQATGTGRFITRDDIRQRNPSRLLDLIRFLPGVRTNCYGLTCQVRLNHDPRDCGPAVFIDDVQTTMAVLEATSPSSVQGLEIYRGPSETPPEINVDAARCGGAIVIWTRRGLAP